MNIDNHSIEFPKYVGWSHTSMSDTYSGQKLVRITAHAALDEADDIGLQDAFDECLTAVEQYGNEIGPLGVVTGFELRVIRLGGVELEAYRKDGQSYLKFSECRSIEMG